MRKTFITLLTLAASLTAGASDADSTLAEHLGMWQSVRSEAILNPALHATAYNSSFSQLYMQTAIRRQSEAFEQEKGDGFFHPELRVESFLRLSERTAVWGEAGYMNGRQRNIRWNSTSDYDLLKPYILADTLGGDTRLERYLFSGGYATRLNNWLLGAEMLFRADQEYRDTDPRMRGIVNDLTLRLGAAYNTAGYHWALAFEGNIYKQTNSVVFYRELGVIPEYQMTGLGTEYARFSGDKRTLYYKGGSKRLLIDVEPESGAAGPYAHLSLEEACHKRVIAELNSMPLTDMYRDQVAATLGWRGHSWAVFTQFSYADRNGEEHIAGTSAATYFPIIGKRTMYKNHLMDASLSATYGQKAALDWRLTGRGGYLQNHERYVYPERRMEYSRYYGTLSGELFYGTGRWSFMGNLSAAYYANADSKLSLPYSDMQPAFIDKADRQFEFAKADYTEVKALLRADCKMKKAYSLFASLGGGYIDCSVGERQLDASLSLGITF